MCNVEFYPGMISFVPGAGKGFQKWSPPTYNVYATKSSCTGVYHPGDKIGKKTNSSRTNFTFFNRSTKFKENKHLLSRML